MDKTRKLIKQSILLAISALSDDIQGDADKDNNLTRAEAIKRLAEAYRSVDR